MVKNFRHTCIIVSNLAKSLRFYQDILGLRVFKILTIKGEYPEKLFKKKGIKITYAKLRAPGQKRSAPAIFELHYWQKPLLLPKPGYVHLSFSVANLASEYQRLSKKGVRFISPPVKTPYLNTKVCFAYDPDNYLIEFVEDLKRN